MIAESDGEAIRPHPKFRVFATGYSVGAGGGSGLYQGGLRQDLAFVDRFRVVLVGYREPAVEKEMTYPDGSVKEWGYAELGTEIDLPPICNQNAGTFEIAGYGCLYRVPARQPAGHGATTRDPGPRGNHLDHRLRAGLRRR